MIANGQHGIMVLTKIPFQIDMMVDAKLSMKKVMITIRFFELQNKMITTTDKTEIEIESNVCNNLILLFF